MIGEPRVLVTPALPLTSNLPVITRKVSFFRRIWPAGGLSIAVVVNEDLDGPSRILVFQGSNVNLKFAAPCCCSWR